MDSTGRSWERRAERFLREQGLTTITRNFSAKCGEIDLVMRDRDQVAFIEVRCAQLFLQKFPKWAHHPCRFDVIAYDSGVSIGEPVWIRAAFQ